MLVRQGCKSAECVKRGSVKNTINENQNLSIAPSFSRNESAQISEVLEEPKQIMDWDRNNYAPTSSSGIVRISNGDPMEISDDTEDESEDSGEQEPNYEEENMLIARDFFRQIAEGCCKNWLEEHNEHLENKIVSNYQITPKVTKKRTLAQSRKR